jgi:glycerol kinase
LSEPFDYCLAIDQGSHASRAVVFDSGGAIHGRAGAGIDTRRTADGFIEHDPEQLIASVRVVIEQALRDSALAAGARVMLALATQRSTIVCWDRATGRALSPAISWQDRRNAAWLEGLQGQADRIREWTGLRLSPHYGASKLRWCLDHLVGVQGAARSGRLACGPLASYIVARITREGSFCADPANASRTLLWSPASLDWCADLLAWFGIERAWLPEAVPTAYAYGSMSACGADLPLVIVTGDQSAVPFALGALDSDAVYINIGTGAFIQRPTSERAPPPLLTSILYADATRRIFVEEGTVNGAGSALAWLADTRAIDVDGIVRTLRARDLGTLDPPLFLNAVSGLGSPYWRADLEPRFSAPAGFTEYVAAVLDSIAFLIDANLALMRGRGRKVERIIVTGGLSQSEYLSQAVADVSGLPVTRPDAVEATARGAAALAFGLEHVFEPLSSVEIRPRANTALERRHAAWRNMMAALVAPSP